MHVLYITSATHLFSHGQRKSPFHEKSQQQKKRTTAFFPRFLEHYEDPSGGGCCCLAALVRTTFKYCEWTKSINRSSCKSDSSVSCNDFLSKAKAGNVVVVVVVVPVVAEAGMKCGCGCGDTKRGDAAAETRF